MGRHLENQGLLVTRQHKATIQDIVDVHNVHECLIVAVDGGELLENKSEEIKEDTILGHIPDHNTVVVLSCDIENKTITIYDPNSVNPEDTYPIDQFKDAWGTILKIT